MNKGSHTKKEYFFFTQQEIRCRNVNTKRKKTGC